MIDRVILYDSIPAPIGWRASTTPGSLNIDWAREIYWAGSIHERSIHRTDRSAVKMGGDTRYYPTSPILVRDGFVVQPFATKNLEAPVLVNLWIGISEVPVSESVMTVYRLLWAMDPYSHLVLFGDVDTYM